jgi:LytS/YehU family sensor histidine kinase
MVINKDETEARLLLADFATLMRTILENSSQTKITLNNELAFLKLYTKLESTRFNNRIKINYQIQNSIAPNHILIPPMLIQPFIENAFNHAFPPTITKPTININFKTNDTLTELICTIEDNGIGIQANDHKSQNHKSLATKITNERIVMLNTIEPNNLYSINIQDLANNSNNSSGTKITIIIPLNQ